MTRHLLQAVLLGAAGLSQQAWAEEPRGCDKFAWPLVKEQAALTAPALPNLGDGSAAPASTQAVTVQLRKFAEAGLPVKPERGPKRPESYAGYITLAAPPAATRYQVTLSAAAWIDLVQAGQYVKPAAFSGALDCPGVRKSVRFDVRSAPFTLQFSDVENPTISIVVAPVTP